MVLLGFSIGKSDDGGMGKSLDDIIADRRKEQAKASSGRNARDGKNKASNAKEKKNIVADRSIGTGRAKRAAAARARRGFSNNGAAKPSAMEVEKEVYRQARKTSTTKKKAEKKASNGRLPPNSSLREKKNTRNSNNKKTNNNSMDDSANDPPGVFFGRIPQQKQIKAAIQGMQDAGCPVPEGFQLVMQFSPTVVQEKGKKPNKNSNNNRNNNNNSNRNGNGNGNNNNQRSGNNNNNNGRRRSGRGQRN